MVDVKTATLKVMLLLALAGLCSCATTEELFPEYDHQFCVTPESATPEITVIKKKEKKSREH